MNVAALIAWLVTALGGFYLLGKWLAGRGARGVGLAWLASGARPGTRLVSVERDATRAALAAELFAGQPDVTVIPGHWTEIAREAPFDLLALDGGGQGKDGGPAADPEALLRPGGTLVVTRRFPA